MYCQDEDETPEEYVAKYNPPTPELGGVYRCWEACRSPKDVGILFRIVHIDDKIALGKRIGGDSTFNPYRLFYSSGLYAGFKYKDTIRPIYRLHEKVEMEN